MIEHTTLAEARIVIVGLDDLTNAVIQGLVAFGKIFMALTMRCPCSVRVHEIS